MAEIRYRTFPGHFKVAFSFSGAQRSKVRAVAEELERNLGEGVVFFDEWFESYVAGDDADLRLQDIYSKLSDLVIVCVSSSYNDKPWTQLEHRAIRALTMQLGRRSLRVLPLRFGEGEVDGILANAVVPDVRERSVQEISGLISARLAYILEAAVDRKSKASDLNVPATGSAVLAKEVPPQHRPSNNAEHASGLNVGQNGAISLGEQKLAEAPPFDLERFRRLKDYASSGDGLSLDRTSAVAWAEQKLAQVPPFDLERFKQLKNYAYSGDGLNLDRAGAVAWAEQKLAQVPPFDLERFKQLKNYAYSGGGLNLDRAAAVEWAERKLAESRQSTTSTSN